MFNQLFKKKTKDITTLLKDVQESEKKDFHAMFHAYYQLGEAYYKTEDFERASHYLNRANSLSLSIEELNVSDDDIDHCSEMLFELEKKDMLMETTLQDVNNKAEELNYDQRSLWNLLTLCRMEIIFKEFAKVPDCEIFNQIPHMIDLLFQIITGEIEYDESSEDGDFLSDLYDFSDSETFYNPQTTISLPSLNQPIQLFDFVGGDVITSLDMFVDHELNFTDEDDFTSDFVVSALGTLKSYYIRTQDSDIHQIPQIQNELKRIQDDYQFILAIPDEDDFINRMKEYRQLNIFD